MKQLELQEDQSYLGRVCSRLVNNNKQFKTSLKNILRHLDILEDGDEVVEQEISLGQEDVEDTLERIQQPWLHFLQTSSSFRHLPAFSPVPSWPAAVAALLPGPVPSCGSPQVKDSFQRIPPCSCLTCRNFTISSHSALLQRLENSTKSSLATPLQEQQKLPPFYLLKRS